jgi:cytidylate kinase
MDIRNLQIAIDGPAASGKSTVATIVAKELGFTHIDTGSMYRAITLEALNRKIDIEDEANFDFVKDLSFEFINDHLYMNGVDVSKDIREHIISNNVSLVSSYFSIRKECVKFQRLIAERENTVMDGRDIGTVVLPDADFKFFLVASIEKRAKRRFEDNLKRGIKSNIEIIKEKIAERDHFDSNRKHSPLKPAEDAFIIDTSDLTIEQVVALITKRIRGNE